MRRKKEGEEISKLREEVEEEEWESLWEEGLGSERERARGGRRGKRYLHRGGQESECGKRAARSCAEEADGRFGRSLDRNSEAGLTVAQQSRGSKRDSRSGLSME